MDSSFLLTLKVFFIWEIFFEFLEKLEREWVNKNIYWYGIESDKEGNIEM